MGMPEELEQKFMPIDPSTCESVMCWQCFMQGILVDERGTLTFESIGTPPSRGPRVNCPGLRFCRIDVYVK